MAPNLLLMAIRGNESKRKRKRTGTRTIKREDRLSSLPDDILIKILSCLPLQLAMATGCLSWRWRDLWTNVTSIHIEDYKFNCLRYFDTTIDDILTRITSPFIQSVSVKFGDARRIPRQEAKYPKCTLGRSWLRQICDRNVRELKVTNPGSTYYNNDLIHSGFTLPSFICVTRSLVSIELDTTLMLPLPDNRVRINLPNLKKLHLCSTTMHSKSLEKLINACPSLEELGFVYNSCKRPFERRTGRNGLTPLCYIKFSHQNLQRLFIRNLPNKYRVVINAPKLEYLAISASTSSAFRFEKEPMMLREAKIGLNSYNYYSCTLTEDEIKSTTKFYGLFRNVTILTPDVFVLENSWPSNMFCNATQLTLSMTASCNINILLAIVELCPVLDVLTLQIRNPNGMERAAKMPGLVSSLQRVLDKIKIEIECKTDDNTTKSLIELVEYLLSKSVDLKQFHVIIDSSSHRMVAPQIREMKLCQLLYQCPVLSAGCEVEFVGKFFKMSRKGGLKIKIANGKDSPIN